MPHKYWYCGTFDFKKVSKMRFYCTRIFYKIPQLSPKTLSM